MSKLSLEERIKRIEELLLFRWGTLDIEKHKEMRQEANKLYEEMEEKIAKAHNRLDETKKRNRKRMIKILSELEKE
ncbi:hypothetical protein AKJ59_00520 [candidate division MSBL1 archaeon SCGC-AAA385M02]|uniref:Uncharacterized protein n=1 Tax=candidate division MSBL1 archaeon SCGC-AAA385M02 TaxID=1698287 RepID=A0A133VQS1_9EURY|nr:hypothetical protein AKJ59_00520 [candidate division MSBL1 archaeon SCGC-AAA385M02]